eukprot:scaffold111835_cov59-Phaeocystis_antarctica.AAC.2
MGALGLPCTAPPSIPTADPSSHAPLTSRIRSYLHQRYVRGQSVLHVSAPLPDGVPLSPHCHELFYGRSRAIVLVLRRPAAVHPATCCRLPLLLLRICAQQPLKHTTLQPLSNCRNEIPSVAGASTRAPKYDVVVSPDLPLWVRLDARDVRRIQSCARPRPA